MTIEFSSDIGFTTQLPDGSFRVEESSAGAGTEQFSLPGGAYVSLVRDDGQVHDYAQAMEWAQKMAAYYQDEFGGRVLTEGRLQSAGKQSYAVAVAYRDPDEVPRLATITGILFPGGAFFGLTLLAVAPDGDPDVTFVQGIVDGMALADAG